MECLLSTSLLHAVAIYALPLTCTPHPPNIAFTQRLTGQEECSAADVASSVAAWSQWSSRSVSVWVKMLAARVWACLDSQVDRHEICPCPVCGSRCWTMGGMGLPELDVARVRVWCEARVPEAARFQVRLEAEVADRHVTIVECRAPWDGQGSWTRFPIARLRFTKATGLWTLFWRDRNLKFHSYADRLAPTPRVGEILEFLDSGVDPIFFG